MKRIANQFSRRQMIQFGASGVAMSLIPWRRGFADPAAATPHFLLEVMLINGWDPSYTFDARPLAMTAAGKIQNYRGTEPGKWTGSNGGEALVTEIAEPLKPYFPYFSILNGVHMAATFDGHEQNRNFLLTGNPFGGEMLLPHLNRGAEQTALDFVQVGELFGLALSNLGGGVILDPDTAVAVANGVSGGEGGATADPAAGYIEQRLVAAGAGDPASGLFAGGAANMLKGMRDSKDLARRMQGLKIDETDELRKALRLAQQYYQRGISRSALIVLDKYTLDTHDPVSAKQQPQTYAEVVKDLGAIFKYLTEEMFDAAAGVRMIDVTTVVITSEFGRTMRQNGKAIDETGTDHNPQSNTVLIGGKGILPGMIVGQSDRQTADEVVTKAHQSLDDGGVKAMGRPFDFTTLAPTAGINPEALVEYKAEDYLTFASVANTLYTMFGADKKYLWKLKRNTEDTAQVLTKLMKT